MKVKIFTEGGKNIGLGHITRCSSLYEEVANRGIDVELIIYGDISGVSLLNDVVHRNDNWIDKDYLRNELSKEDHVIVDSYLTPLEIYEEIASRVKSATYIDDTDRIKYPEGTVVKPRFNPESNMDVGNNVLSGSKYIILRTPFIGPKREKVIKELSKVLIMMGGMDTKNLTGQIVNTIVKENPAVKFDVVVGSEQFNHMREHYAYSNVNYFTGLKAEKLKDLMEVSDAVITAAGQTIFELIAMQTPFIPIQVAENQINNIQAVKKYLTSKIIINSESGNYLKDLELIFDEIKIESFRKTLVQSMNNLVDGQGRKRIVDHLLNKQKSDNVEEILLRRVEKSDMNDVYQLSNKKYVREHSISKDFITWENHIEWFENVLEDKKTVFYVVTDKSSSFLGQVRFEIQNNQATISISLSEKLKGKGQASTIIKLACNNLLSNYTAIEKILAYISPKNIASLIAFKKVGFKEVEQNEEMNGFVLKRGEFYDNR